MSIRSAPRASAPRPRCPRAGNERALSDCLATFSRSRGLCQRSSADCWAITRTRPMGKETDPASTSPRSAVGSAASALLSKSTASRQKARAREPGTASKVLRESPLEAKRQGGAAGPQRGGSGKKRRAARGQARTGRSEVRSGARERGWADGSWFPACEVANVGSSRPERSKPRTCLEFLLGVRATQAREQIVAENRHRRHAGKSLRAREMLG